MRSRDGLALANTLIFVVLLMLLSGIVMSAVSSNARLTERQIRRLRSQYAVEGASTIALELYRRGLAVPATGTAPWTFSDAGVPLSTITVSISSSAGTGPNGTRTVNASYDYHQDW